MAGASWFVAGCGRGDDGQAGCGPGGESSVEVCGVDQAELLQGRCGEAGLVSLVADQDDAEVPAGDDGVTPLGGGVAAPFQAVAGDRQGAGNQAVALLVVTADVDQELHHWPARAVPHPVRDGAAACPWPGRAAHLRSWRIQVRRWWPPVG